MNLSKRESVGLSGILSLVLSGLVGRDMYRDSVVEGKSVVSTVVENAPLIALSLGVFVACYWVSRAEKATHVLTVSRWQVYGAAGMAALVGWVVGIQAIQGQLKPFVLTVQTAIGGALAGTVIGYANVRSQKSLAEVQEERNKFQALFDNIPAEIAEVSHADGSLAIRQVNTSFEQMFGGVEDNATLADAATHDAETHDMIRGCVETGDTLESNVAVETTDGSAYFQLRVAPFGEQRAYVIYLDVTEMRDVQRELEETVTELERSNDRLEDFAYIASHDLQEPLRTVSRYAALVTDEYGDELDETANNYLETVVTGAERMSSMIDGLLDYSRVTTRGDEFDEVDTESVLDGVRQDLDLMLSDEDGSVTYGSLPTVEADRDQLWQVFQNLLKNALEHSEDGPVEISVSATEDEEAHSFIVEDDGPGIDPYLQDDVFNMFESGQNYQTEGKAKGIGLAIVERIVDRHGGDIWVDSEPGKGSSFQFSIPKQITDD